MRSIIHAPADPSLWPEWREQLTTWRESARRLLGYDGAPYRLPSFSWVASAYSCYFLMMCDQAFVDPQTGEYAVEAFLERGRREFGGYDSVLLWHAYPRIGFDERNQFDFWRDMPGGLDGLREVVRQMHERGVRVYIPYLRWDKGTRREERPDFETLAGVVAAMRADGVFLDTSSQGTLDLRERLDAVRPGAVLIPENALPVEKLYYHHVSWAQRFDDSPVPGVLAHKWLERRHMQYQTSRWKLDQTGEIHTAWMNGSGILIWENVFGSWVGWSPRARSLLRALLPILRRYADVFAGEAWTPLVDVASPGVYASRWQGQGLSLWTLVNRGDAAVEGPLIEVECAEGMRFFDLVAGREIKTRGGVVPATLPGRIAPRGIGCLLAAREEHLGGDFGSFLARQAANHARADDDPTPPVLLEQLRPVQPTRPYRPDQLPEGMVSVPGAELDLEVRFRIRECGFYDVPGLPRLNAGEIIESGGLHRFASLKRRVVLRPYAIDAVPVTNQEFARFLAATGYRPRCERNFLKHWVGGRPPEGQEDHPVVYVDLEDARAYARWAGKRLPTEEEWQYAAQGPSGRLFPWGDAMREGACNSGVSGGTTAVLAFPGGRSWVGCHDMCGNVWEWTESERSDGRTRSCVLKGGSYYRAWGSEWYADGGPQPSRYAAKFLLTWPGLDRCSTIGFRCVVDLAG